MKPVKRRSLDRDFEPVPSEPTQWRFWLFVALTVCIAFVVLAIA